MREGDGVAKYLTYLLGDTKIRMPPKRGPARHTDPAFEHKAGIQQAPQGLRLLPLRTGKFDSDTAIDVDSPGNSPVPAGSTSLDAGVVSEVVAPTPKQSPAPGESTAGPPRGGRWTTPWTRPGPKAARGSVAAAVSPPPHPSRDVSRTPCGTPRRARELVCRNPDTQATTADPQAIAYDWSRSPGMEVHVELMARVAKLVAPFLTLGGQGSVVNSEFLWQRGKAQLMEFLQAATCADHLEVLWKRMDDDADEEVDPSTMVLEILGQEDAVLDQGNNESPIPIEDAGGEIGGKAPEVSPEEETSSGSSRLAGTRMFLWSVGRLN